MKKHIVLLSVLLMQSAAVSVFAQDELQPEYVDLGLSVKWATCNVGADKPEDFGDYYLFLTSLSVQKVFCFLQTISADTTVVAS